MPDPPGDRSPRPVDAQELEVPNWPVPVGEPAILFGGTFDPPHLGHVHAAITAREAFDPEAAIVLVPAGRSPHKSTGPIASDQQRLDMLALAFERTPRVRLWRHELRRGRQLTEPSFTADTVRVARNAATPRARLGLVIGGDQAASFHRWRDPERIASLVELVVVVRTPFESASDLLEAGFDPGRWNASIIEAPLVSASSTDIRAGRWGVSLPPKVAAYVEAHGLYRDGTDS